MWEYNYICHHGIKGQRWGIRRYQNEDGSLTPAGRRRELENKHDNPKNVSEKSGLKKYVVSPEEAKKNVKSSLITTGAIAAAVVLAEIPAAAPAMVALGSYAVVGLSGLAVVGIGAAAVKKIIDKNRAQGAKAIESGLGTDDKKHKN